MYYVYLIFSTKTKELYIGYTNNLEKRVREHNTDKNVSTKGKGTWIHVYSEMYKSKEDARTREKRLKNYGQALNELKKRINGSLQLANLVRGR